MSKALGIIISVALIVGVGGYFLATSANAATPADTLYPVDTALESVQRLLTFDSVAKVNLEQALLEERQLEIETMLQDEGVTQDQIQEALRLMVQQRTRAYEKLGELQQKQVENGNVKAAESIAQAQERYLEHLDTQLETAQKAEKKFTGLNSDVTQEMQVNMEEEKNSLQNAGESTENKVQNQEQNTDNSNSENGSGSSNSSDKGKN